MSRLVDSASAVPVIALIAPGGFGKSETARLISRRFRRSVLLRARADVHRDLLNEAPDDADCIVIERAELLSAEYWREALTRLLARGRTVVICARRTPRGFALADLARLHDTAIICGDSLALTFEEMRELAMLTGPPLSAAVLFAIYSITGGWPVPTRMLVESAQTTGFGKRQPTVEDPALQCVFDWLEDNVLDALDEGSRETLFRCVASVELTSDDLACLSQTQLVSVLPGDEIHVAPLIDLLLHARYERTVQEYAANERAVRPSRQNFVLDVARGELHRNGEIVRVTENSLQLLTLLAVLGSPVRREVVADRLWPELDGDRAVNVLKACVYRVRRQLGDHSVVVMASRTIAMGDNVRSTFPEIVDLTALAGDAREIDETTQSRMVETVESIEHGVKSGWAPWGWFVPWRKRLHDAARSIATRLVEDEMRRGNVRTARRLTSSFGAAPDDDSRELLA